MKLRAPHSLFGQLLVSQIVAALILATVLPLIVTALLNRTTTEYQMESLARQATLIKRGLSHDESGWRVQLDPTLRALYDAGYDGRAYAVFAGNGALLTSSRHPQSAVNARPVLGLKADYFERGSVDALSVPATQANQKVWIIVSQDRNDPEVVVDDVVAAFLSRFLIALVPIFLVVPLLAMLYIRRSTRAVLKVSKLAEQIGPTRLDIRLPVETLPTEVAPLATATNEALDRVEQGFVNQREFVANVAHELRTPLALMTLQLDALKDHAAKSQLLGTIGRATHVVTQLLDLASLERLAIDPSETFDAGQVAREAVETMAPAVYDGNRTIGLTGGETQIYLPGRAAMILIAVTNLIDNAARHTLEGSHIEVIVASDGGIIVADNGPGIASSELPNLSKRFHRADHARTDSAGLGLSIVANIMQAHGGRLLVSNLPSGGASFKLAF